ncbi:MAG: ACP phosphodiesterase [Pseudomonadota bacterium]
MNFLAHFHLAWPDHGLLVGALEGDFHRGVLRGDLPQPLERGIRLHRAIDAHTDSHPLVKHLCQSLPSRLRRYAGILIDLSFDHYLNHHWDRFSDTALPAFCHSVHDCLSQQQGWLSQGARSMLQRLIEHQIMLRYRDWDVVIASAERIGERFSRGNPFYDLDRDLTPMRAQIERTFLEFYPQLCQFRRSGAWE